MISFKCNKNPEQLIVFDLLEMNDNAKNSCKSLNIFLERNDIEVVKQAPPLYQPPPMFPDENTGTRAKMLVTITYRKKGKKNAK